MTPKRSNGSAERGSLRGLVLARIALACVVLFGLAGGTAAYLDGQDLAVTLLVVPIAMLFALGTSVAVRHLACMVLGLFGRPCASDDETNRDTRKWFDGSGSV